MNANNPILGARAPADPYAPAAQATWAGAATGDEPWVEADRLRATHLRIAWSGFLASVMTVVVGCALYLVQ